MPDYISLLAENMLLKKKLEIASNWMKKEVIAEKKALSSDKLNRLVQENKDMFLYDNIEEIINKNIQSFFWELMLINIPSNILENIISAEITYYNFRKHTARDGFAVISSYHKALDIIIAECITEKFRNYVDVNRLWKDIENDSLNKALASVIHNHYSLSVGRLYHLTKTLRDYKLREENNEKRNKERLPQYSFLFLKFLENNYELRRIILDDNSFLEIFQKLIDSEVLWSKRHKGKITFVETREARRLIIWDFKNKESLIYKLLESEEII